MKEADPVQPLNPERFDAYLEDMRLLDPDYDLPLIDFWNPDIVHRLDEITLVRDEPLSMRARIGPFTVIYSRGRSIPVQLEIRETASGRRLRQDGEDESPILDRLFARWKNETR